LKPKYNKLLSNFAFNCNLCHYTLEEDLRAAEMAYARSEAAAADASKAAALQAATAREDASRARAALEAKVGRCRFTLGFTVDPTISFKR